MLTLEEGRRAVRLAREALTAYVSRKEIINPHDLPGVFNEKRGVFVTLEKKGELRGCIGYPRAVLPLGRAIVDSAINAGTRDPRFPRVHREELDDITIEVTVLTEPEVIDGDRKTLPERIEIGRHGLIVTSGMYSGLLLPQVATEYGFDSVDFLCQTCLKAGLPVDAWLDDDTVVECFEAQIFSETSPNGDVIEKRLPACETR
ncbi:MAG: TIGR00296 family protein [Methanothrix sp.]|uniref:TIGR00296 family protein n=1 Tax=Methanothrix sp. TaxID=90426 RepID=UPI0025D18FEE|nr:TIGR00296 family protein [Methanothrix sp.]MCQ8903135.1 TIGR00296 family protein [Methanothrix sp.]